MTVRKGADNKVTVRFVPTSGKSRTVEVSTSESPLDALLEAAKISGKNHQVSVDGRPVTDMKSTVSAGAVVVVTEKARGS